jgi:hypothetical protein
MINQARPDHRGMLESNRAPIDPKTTRAAIAQYARNQIKRPLCPAPPRGLQRPQINRGRVLIKRQI